MEIGASGTTSPDWDRCLAELSVGLCTMFLSVQTASHELAHDMRQWHTGRPPQIRRRCFGHMIGTACDSTFCSVSLKKVCTWVQRCAGIAFAAAPWSGYCAPFKICPPVERVQGPPVLLVQCNHLCTFNYEIKNQQQNMHAYGYGGYAGIRKNWFCTSVWIRRIW
jgi:hypothetical protein